MIDAVLYGQNSNYCPAQLRLMEMDILAKFEWNLTTVTTLHLLQYFVAKGSVFEADRIKDKRLPSKVPKYMKKYAYFFTEICLQDFRFQEYPTSLLAAGMLACCRRSLFIKPIWRPELTNLTGYCMEDIQEVYERVWLHYMTSFPAEADRREKLGGCSDTAYYSPNSISGV
jgi:hypothetical protein